MLYVDLGETVYKPAGHPDGLYANAWRNDWFRDERAKKYILEIDGSTVISDRIVMHPLFGDRTHAEISAGAKNVLLALFTGLIIDGDFMGGNCWTPLLEIAETKDVYVTLQHVPKLPKEFTLTVVNSGNVVHTIGQFADEVLDANWGKGEDI